MSVYLFSVVNGLRAPAVMVLDSNVNLGEDATIKCAYEIFDARSRDTVSWFNCTSAGTILNVLFNTYIDISPKGRYSIDISQDNVAILTISNTLLSDSGYYKCTVVDSSFYSNSDFASLTVQYLDEIMIDVSSYTDERNVIITCSVNGYPIPQMELYKDDTIIMTETTKLIYMIDIITESDGGSYKCNASNIVDVKTSEIVLDYYAPVITFVRDVIVGPGEDIVAAPKVSANPNDITYKWVTNPPGINDTDNDTATFTFRVAEVVGTNYTITVTVTNSIGSATNSVKITVQNPCVDDPCGYNNICEVIERGYSCIPFDYSDALNCPRKFNEDTAIKN
ncbi:CD166 antigen homolog [Anneissia japonica]|uniref:CD166 antigen homolog n=1 Tax=Anneissia japonica TaxID=1529436 RepID=UPI0014258BC6|nr:CD166 antigen homolog [Anneissia japonica]